MRKMYLIIDVETKETFLPEEFAQLRGIKNVMKKLREAFADNNSATIRVNSDHSCFQPKVRVPRPVVTKEGNKIKGYPGRKLYVFADGTVKYTRTAPAEYFLCVDLKHKMTNKLGEEAKSVIEVWETGIKKNDEPLLA